MGIAKIDSQHRTLFSICNELLEIQNVNDGAAKFGAVLQHLRGYVNTHFSDEEALMSQMGYPALAEHKMLHEKIIDEINTTVRATKDLFSLKKELYLMLDNWIRQHILIEDKKISEWYQNHRLDLPDLN